jgi:hypothetical protein
MDYVGQWGGGDPGHSWALKWHERSSLEINIRSFHGSLVERPYSIRGARFQSQANTLYF